MKSNVLRGETRAAKDVVPATLFNPHCDAGNMAPNSGDFERRGA